MTLDEAVAVQARVSRTDNLSVIYPTYSIHFKRILFCFPSEQIGCSADYAEFEFPSLCRKPVSANPDAEGYDTYRRDTHNDINHQSHCFPMELISSMRH